MSDEAFAAPDDLLLLGMASLSNADIKRQVDRICNSPAFDDGEQAREVLRYLVREVLAGKVPRTPDIARMLGKINLDTGESFVRTAVNRMRERLRKYYSIDAKPGEIKLVIPRGQYFVLTPKIVGTTRARIQVNPDSLSGSVILEPQDRAEVYAQVTVKGRTGGIDPDLRVWLVVGVSYYYYPQCRVSRRNPEWEYDVRIGRLPWGGPDEGGEFDINFVAAGVDGDASFYQYQKAGGDGFGSVLPVDVFLLDSKRVTRRDIRSES